MAQQVINGISIGAIYALVSVGFSLIFNVMKLVNFAHGGMILVGAYTAYFMLTWARVPGLVALVVAGALAALASYLSEKVILRPIRRRNSPMIYFFVASITLFILLESFVSAATGANILAYPRKLGEGNLAIAGLSVAWLDLYVLAVTAVALYLTVWLLYRTRVGLAVRAAAFDPRAASLMGINLDVVISVTFAVAGLLAGIGGVFLGVKYAVYPQVGQLVFKAFVACMVGGLGSLPGAVLGALLLGLAETFITAYVHAGLSAALTFTFLIVFLLLRPNGIMGVFIEDKV